MFVKRHIGFYVIIVSLVCILYVPTLKFGYVSFDDDKLIRDNMVSLRNPSAFLKVFQTHYFEAESLYGSYYRPLVTLSYKVDAIIGRGRPFIFHLTNIILFSAGVCLLFSFLQNISLVSLRINLITVSDKGPFPLWIAFLCCLLFAVHPANAFAVAWIPGRNDLLFLCFAIISFDSFVKYSTEKLGCFLGLHAVSLFLSLLTKESAICIPFLCLSWVLLVDTKKRENTLNQKDVSFLNRLIMWIVSVAKDSPIMCWFSLAFAWLLIRGLVLGLPGFSSGMNVTPSSLPLIFTIATDYLGKTIFPIHTTLIPTLSAINNKVGLASVFFVLIGLFVFRKGRGVSVFGLIWFFSFVVVSTPYTDLSDIENLSLLEHRLYVPMIGMLLYLIGVWVGVHSYCLQKNVLADSQEKNIQVAKPRFVLARIAVVVLAIVIFVLFSIASIYRIPQFYDSYSFWTSATKQSPNSELTNLNLGAILLQEGRLAEGKLYIEKALSINPTKRFANLNMAGYYIAINDFQKAEPFIRREIQLHPDSIQPYIAMSAIYERMGKRKESQYWKVKAQEVERAIQINLYRSDIKYNFQSL